MSLRRSLEPRASMWAFLAHQLWFHRTQRGLTCAQVGRLTHCVRQTVSNWEAGRYRINEDQAKALDKAWDTGRFFELLLWFARTAHDPDWFAQYVQYEKTANSIKIYQGQIMPGLLQTPEYAHVILSSAVDDVESAIDSRMVRQEILASPAPPLLWVLLHQSALELPVGGPEVMHAQLAKLLELARRPDVSIRVVENSIGYHVGMDGSLQIMDTGDRELAYVGALGGGRLAEAPSEVRSFSLMYDKIGAKASSEDASAALIRQAMETMQ